MDINGFIAVENKRKDVNIIEDTVILLFLFLSLLALMTINYSLSYVIHQLN